MPETLEMLSEALGHADPEWTSQRSARQNVGVDSAALPDFDLHFESHSSEQCVVAHARGERVDAWIMITYTSEADEARLSLLMNGQRREWSSEELARHSVMPVLVRWIADERDRNARDGHLLNALLQSLFVYACRAKLGVSGGGSERETVDPRVARVLALFERQIAKPWTVGSLARAVGLSRAALAQRFRQAVGQSPMRYLTQRRMQVAAALLVASDTTLAEIAGRVGYESEFAFNRAFKRHYGVPPGAYRRQALAAVHRVYARAA